MSKKLRQLGKEKRSRFRATFDQLSTRPSWWYETTVKTIIFKNIVLVKTGAEVAKFLRFDYRKGFQKLGELEQGQQVEFDARVQENTTLWSKGWDWRLSHPTKIKRAGDEV